MSRLHPSIKSRGLLCMEWGYVRSDNMEQPHEAIVTVITILHIWRAPRECRWHICIIWSAAQDDKVRAPYWCTTPENVCMSVMKGVNNATILALFLNGSSSLYGHYKHPKLNIFNRLPLPHLFYHNQAGQYCNENDEARYGNWHFGSFLSE